MGKYNLNKKESIRIQHIYENIPSQLAKENQKFVFAKLDERDNRKRDYITAIDWLVASNLVLMCKAVREPIFPLRGYVDNDTFKLYLNDTGIFNSLLNIPSYIYLLNGDNPFKGVVVENYVASELIKMGYDLFYWSKKGKNKGMAELDFVIQIENQVIPLEVKAGADTKAKSLDAYKESINPI